MTINVTDALKRCGEAWQTACTTFFAENAKNTARHSSDALTPLVDVAEVLEWFSGQRRLSLAHYSPMYGDDDDEAVEWRVHRESGSINDREWEVIGRGETVLAAMLDARAALRSAQESEVGNG